MVNDTDEVTGRAKGGAARAAKLSPERRSEIAKTGALARLARLNAPPVDEDIAGLPRAEWGAADRPLRIGEWEVPCYVLSDKRRVLVQRGMMTALDMKQGTAGRGGGDRLAKFAATKSLNPFISNELAEVIKNPIIFQSPSGGRAYGYEATILADLCDAVLEARKRGALHYQQEHIAERCEALVRAFAKVGIIALVDEATGYQDIRDRVALQQILDKYLSVDKAKWAKTFPDDFYKKLFRVRGIPYDPRTVKRPGFIGHDTNNLIYDRMSPGVLKKLQELNPKVDTGRRKDKHHQFFTRDYGFPELRDHIKNVMFLLDAAGENNWRFFLTMLNKAAPRQGATIEMDF
jgi:hypothetical protein